MAAAIEVSAQTARRFVLGKQGLWPGRRWTGKRGTREAITACEHLQLDPVNIVARSHDLMLHARTDGYLPEYFDELVYQEREFFDSGGWLAVRPMGELPYWRVVMRREKDHPRLQALRLEHGAVIEEMRELLRSGARLSGRDFEKTSRKAVRHYRGSKDSSVALYYLWRTGEAMTHHREGFERVYAAADAVAAPELLVEAGEPETDRFLLLKEVAFAGIGRVRSLGGHFRREVPPAGAKALVEELVACGDLAPLVVEGWRGTRFILGSDEPLLREVSAGGVPPQWRPLGAPRNELAFLSPLDPVSARGRATELFAFDYAWEIYKRAEDVQFGRYAMPILWGERLVGRMDARHDRARGVLVINGLWLEDEGVAKNLEFHLALRTGIARLMEFLGSRTIDGRCQIPPELCECLAGLSR